MSRHKNPRARDKFTFATFKDEVDKNEVASMAFDRNYTNVGAFVYDVFKRGLEIVKKEKK